MDPDCYEFIFATYVRTTKSHSALITLSYIELFGWTYHV